MNPLFYVVPIVVIVVIVLIMMPFMRKQSKKIGEDMQKIKDKKVHLSILAGNLKSVNGKPAEEIEHVYAIYGIDEDGTLNVEFTPNFTYAGTTYTAHEPMDITFDTVAGNSYDIVVDAKKPKETDTTALEVFPLISKDLIFKTKFYVIVKDATDTQGAKVMRGIQ